MISLVYISSAVKPFSRHELDAILLKSRTNNAALGITGMLLYKDGNLMQALEGEADAVRGLYARIVRDPRHQGLLRLLESPLAERRFGDWSMAFRDLDPSGGPLPDSYSDFLSSPLTGEGFAADPSRSEKLLALFRKNMR